MKFCHHLITLSSFLTCMTFVLFNIFKTYINAKYFSMIEYWLSHSHYFNTLILYKAGYFICICEGECHTTCLHKMIVWTLFWSEIFLNREKEEVSHVILVWLTQVQNIFFVVFHNSRSTKFFYVYMEDALIHSDLHCIQGIHYFSSCGTPMNI